MKPRVLYIASGGIEEPLIVSQVLRYLSRLNGVFEVCHLLTLERKMPENSEAIKANLAGNNICWHGLKSFPGLRVFNLWREIISGFRLGKKLIKKHDLNIVHARSFIPGNIGLRLARTTNAKFLYDMRGFWAEEKYAKGTIKNKGVLYVARSMERRLFKKADALVSLTAAGHEKLRSDGVQTPIHVIPCCVDTELFQPKLASADHSQNKSSLRLISVGSLGAGYLPEACFGLLRSAILLGQDAQLQLLSRGQRQTIQRIAELENCDWGRVQLAAVDPEAVVAYLQKADVGLCMIQPSAAKIASSPTKLAEYLACGLPVIANAEMIGDVGAILKKNQVGVVVDRLDPAGFEMAIERLLVLLQDPELSQRCRRTAVEQFSVDLAVKRYAAAYSDLLAG